jgi:Amidohydrolase family/Complex I intermediate-associated protein 30 (CIA30)
MHDAGIVLGAGTDAGNPLTPHGPSLMFELELFVQAGVLAGDALRAATLDAARILRRDASAGSLDVGKLADALIVDGDPLEDVTALRNIAFVLKDGVVVDREQLVARIDDPSLAREVTRLDAPTLDDFDDGDFACQHGGTWSAMNDAMARGDSQAELAIESGVLRVSGTLGTTSPYGAFAGVSIAFDPGGERCLDFAAYDGFEIRWKGAPRAINLVMQRAAVVDFNVFAARVPLTEEWGTVRIPFNEIQQIGFGKPVAFGVSDIKGITIEARDPPGAKGGAFEFEIDSIVLYRE